MRGNLGLMFDVGYLLVDFSTMSKIASANTSATYFIFYGDFINNTYFLTSLN